ncbi:MAG: ArsR/SmtB family transcription factor [Actinomycetota bacterium]
MTTDEIFAALADETRRRVGLRLSEGGETTASRLAEEIPVSRQAIAKHLMALEEAGLVASERVGRENLYHLTPARLSEAVSWIAEVGGDWDGRLARLRKHLEGGKGR